MSGPLLVLTIGEVVEIANFLFSLDNGLKFQTTQFTDDILCSKCVTGSAWVSASQFLRCQIFYRLSHIILPLRMYLSNKCKSQG